MSKTTSNDKTKKAGSARPYNRYNIWFVLERERIILSKGGSTKWSTTRSLLSQSIQKECESLDLPPLPPRFRHLDLPANWCLADSTKKRPHRKTHGVVAFRDLVKMVAAGWKSIDEDTVEFCSTVEKALKRRHLQLLRKPMSANIDDESQQPNMTLPEPAKPTKQLKPNGKPKQFKSKHTLKTTEVKSIFKQASDMSITTVVKAALPTHMETPGNIVTQIPDVPTCLGDLSGETASIWSNPADPEIIKDFFGKRPSSAPATTVINTYGVEEGGDLSWKASKEVGVFGETSSSGNQMDTFSSLAAGIHAPAVTNQSDPYFGPSNWAVMDDVHPAPVGDGTTAAASLTHNQWDADISDEDIRKMWHSQH